MRIVWLLAALAIVAVLIGVDFAWVSMSCAPVEVAGAHGGGCTTGPAIGFPAAALLSLSGIAAIVFCVYRAVSSPASSRARSGRRAF